MQQNYHIIVLEDKTLFELKLNFAFNFNSNKNLFIL